MRKNRCLRKRRRRRDGRPLDLRGGAKWRGLKAVDEALERKAFIQGKKGVITRTWLIESYYLKGERVAIRLDASPWGMGAILKVNNVIVAFIASPLTSLLVWS